MLVNLDEIEQFRSLVKKDSVLMMQNAILSYMTGRSSQPLIMAMRASLLDEYLGAVKETIANLNGKAKVGYDLVQKHFLDEIVDTYNHPEPDIPFSQEEIVSQVLGRFQEQEAVLTPKKVRDVYRKCLLSDDEVDNDGPTIDFIIGEGIREVSLFSADRLDQNKGEIISLVDELPNIEEGVSFWDMCCDKNGRMWTGEHPTMDKLVQLGVATGTLDYFVPRELWDTLSGEMPYIIRNKQKDESKVLGKKPAEYKDVVEDLKERLSK